MNDDQWSAGDRRIERIVERRPGDPVGCTYGRHYDAPPLYRLIREQPRGGEYVMGGCAKHARQFAARHAIRMPES